MTWSITHGHNSIYSTVYLLHVYIRDHFDLLTILKQPLPRGLRYVPDRVRSIHPCYTTYVLLIVLFC